MNFDKIYRKRFYRKIDVQENMGNNFRVIIDQRVLDLTDFVKVVKCGLVNTIVQQLMMLEGHDITELFENRDKNKLEVFDLKSPADIGKQNNLYWWNDPAFVIGVITTQERHVCITNTMEGKSYQLTVCEEDSIYTIMTKFSTMYATVNIDNTVWCKRDSMYPLVLNKTLTQNGLAWSPDAEISFLQMFQKNKNIRFL